MRDWQSRMCGMGWLAVALASGPAAFAAKSLDAAGCVSARASAVPTRALFEDANRPSQRGAVLKVLAIKQDIQHASRWAVMLDCAHPEWPARMVLLPHTASVSEEVASIASVHTAAAVPVAVRAGGTVRLWKHDGVVSMETTGIAEESGEMGKRVRVRLLRVGMNSAESASYVSGLVRGVGDVEIVQ